MGTNFWPWLFALLATWWVHSTLLLGTAAAVSLFFKDAPPRWREWLWKTAVVLPWLTVPAQYAWQGSCTLWQWELSPSLITERESQAAVPSKKSSPDSDPERSPLLPSEPQQDNQPIEIVAPMLPAMAEKPWETSILIEENDTEPANVLSKPTDVPVISQRPRPGISLSIPIERSSESSVSPPMAPLELPNIEPDPVRVSWPWFVPAVLGVVFGMCVLGTFRFAWVFMATRRLILRSRELTKGAAHKEFHRLLAGCEQRLRVAVRVARISSPNDPDDHTSTQYAGSGVVIESDLLDRLRKTRMPQSEETSRFMGPHAG